MQIRTKMTEGVIACYVISQCHSIKPFKPRLSLTLKELVMWAIFLLWIYPRKGTTAASFRPFVPAASLYRTPETRLKAVSRRALISGGVQTRQEGPGPPQAVNFKGRSVARRGAWLNLQDIPLTETGSPPCYPWQRPSSSDTPRVRGENKARVWFWPFFARFLPETIRFQWLDFSGTCRRPDRLKKKKLSKKGLM